MTLIRKSDNYPVWSNFFNDFFSNNWADWNTNNYAEFNSTLPSVNVKETEDYFNVEMAVPGMVKEDFKVELNNSYLTISAEKKSETENKEVKKEHYTRREFSYCNFSRTFSLPDVVENDKIEAKYENGILSVSIPKREEAKPKPVRLIDIA